MGHVHISLPITVEAVLFYCVIPTLGGVGKKNSLQLLDGSIYKAVVSLEIFPCSSRCMGEAPESFIVFTSSLL